MQAFNWMQDLGRSAGGKVVALLLALAMVFTYSNIFVYSAKAFAEGSEESTTETTVNEDATQPEGETKVDTTVDDTTDTDADVEEDGTENPGEDVTDSTTEGGTTEEEVTTPEEGEETEEVVEPITFDEATGTLTISGIDALDRDTANNIVKELGINAADVTELKISKVNSIAGYAFYTGIVFKNLETVIINDVQSIGDRAFFKSPNLKSISLANIGMVGQNAFSESMLVTTISLNGITSVEAEAFRQCRALTDLTIKNVETFDRSPFSFCVSLSHIELDGKADGITNLGATMFYGCEGLESVSIKNFDSTPIQMFNGCTGLQSAAFESINTLNIQTFVNCENLNTLSIKDVNTVPEQAFIGLAGLRTVSINDVQDLGVNAFASCTGLEDVAIDGVDTIGKYAFYNCTSLKTVDMANIDTIGQFAFQNCTGLETVNMDHIRFIDNYAFWNCENLTTINSLSNVTERINGFTFYGCKNLKGLTVDDLAKMGYVGSNEEIMKRVEAILAGKFNLDSAEEIGQLTTDEENWLVGSVGKSDNWDKYDNGTQIMQQARWSDAENGVADVQVDAYYTGEKQMDYIFVADLSASMAQLGNAADMNARFYDMQSKLLDMTGQLLNAPGYDCKVAIVGFGGLFNNNATVKSSDFMTDATDAKKFIYSLEPLYENTDYGLGFSEAYSLAKLNKGDGRNTVVVFLSDGAPNANSSTDMTGEVYAEQMKGLGVDIFGVLHSPTSGQHDKALAVMNNICNKVYESTNTQEFGEAMNKAFTAVYGNNTITIPVNADEFDVENLSATAGEVSYNDGVITWTLNGMPFTDHKLSYNLVLKEENANRVGTYTYSINKGDASFNGKNGASAGIELTLNRTVEAPVVPPTTTDPETPANPTTPTTPGTPAPTTPVVAVPAAATPVDATPVDAAPIEATPIEDDATPMAQSATGSDEESIADDENPLASVYDAPHCWVHYLMILGMIITMIYAAAVIARRVSNTRSVAELERELIESNEKSHSKVRVGSHA